MIDVALASPSGRPVDSLESWSKHTPPEGKDTQWRDGYSAKETARSWTTGGVPSEVVDALATISVDLTGDVSGYPEHRTRLDNYGRARQHDLLVTADDVVIGIEAKACESYDGLVQARLKTPLPSRKRARCNLMARALFGHQVVVEETGDVLDPALANHGYQLWTATVGTLVEASARNAATAVMLIQQFRRDDADDTTDTRNWPAALRRNQQQFDEFVTDLGPSPRSHATEFVHEGIDFHVLKIESVIHTPPSSP